MVIWQFCLNEGPRVQGGQGHGVLGLNHRNVLKNIQESSSSEPLGSDTLYVVLPSGLLPSLFK